MQTRNTISPYYTIGFSPKAVKDPKTGVTVPSELCSQSLVEWNEIAQGAYHSINAEKSFGDLFPVCVGCRGNLIAYPFILFANAGAPLLSDFPIHEWTCFLGDETDRERFCSPQAIAGKVRYALPKTYKADRYSHCTVTSFKTGHVPPGINSMTDWIMAIYNYGPVTTGFEIYSSFMKFFRGPSRDKIYTAQVFINDINGGEGTTSLGGHAINIVGWARKMRRR